MGHAPSPWTRSALCACALQGCDEVTAPEKCPRIELFSTEANRFLSGFGLDRYMTWSESTASKHRHELCALLGDPVAGLATVRHPCVPLHPRRLLICATELLVRHLACRRHRPVRVCSVAAAAGLPCCTAPSAPSA
jgi:hypothetical protein